MNARAVLPSSGAYTETPVYGLPEGAVFGLRRVQILPANNDKLYTVTAKNENRLDAVSALFYGVPDFWWAIADASKIIDAQKVPVGTVLRIPAKSKLTSE